MLPLYKGTKGEEKSKPTKKLHGNREFFSRY